MCDVIFNRPFNTERQMMIDERGESLVTNYDNN